MKDPALLRHIVYIVDATLFERDYERYGMRYFAERAVRVTVIDTTAFSHPKLLAMETGAPPPCPGITVVPVADEGVLAAQRGLLEDADVAINLVGMTGAIAPVRIYQLIARAGTPYLALATNAFPSPRGTGSGRDNFLGRLRVKLRRLCDEKVNPWHSVIARLPKRIIGITAPAIMVYGGTKSRAVPGMYPVDSSTREVWAHSMDWELFRALRQSPPEPENIAIFIDQNIGFQRDILAENMKHPETHDTYYPKIRAAFDRIERELGLDVVVALNPRSAHTDETCRALFGARKIIKGGTAGLIAGARLVLAHRSTAVGFAVMFDKPVLFMTTKPLQEHWLDAPGIAAMSSALGKVPQLIDDARDIDLGDAFAIDRDSYARYRTEYLKTDASPDLPFWDIVANAIGEIHHPAQAIGAPILT